MNPLNCSNYNIAPQQNQLSISKVLNTKSGFKYTISIDQNPFPDCLSGIIKENIGPAIQSNSFPKEWATEITCFPSDTISLEMENEKMMRVFEEIR